MDFDTIKLLTDDDIIRAIKLWRDDIDAGWFEATALICNIEQTLESRRYVMPDGLPVTQIIPDEEGRLVMSDSQTA